MSPHDLDHNEQWALRLLRDHEHVALGWAAHQPGAPERDEALEALTTLERAGLAEYDPAGLNWTITPEGHDAMRFRTNKTTSAAAANAPVTKERSGLLSDGGGHNSGAVDARNPSTAPALIAERDRIVLEMSGPAALAEEIVRGEPDLAEALTSALADGFTAPDLLEVPRRKRMALVEEALEEFRRGRLGGPCEICGTATARLGYIARSYGEHPDNPGFTNGKCLWCREALREVQPERLRSIMFGALVGLRNLNGTNAGVPFFHELKEHIPDLRPGEPWAYLSRPLLDGMVKALALPPHCYITTQRDSILHSFDTITAPIHRPEDLPAPPARVPIFTEPSRAKQQADKEYAALVAWRERTREEWKRRREGSFEFVDAGGGPTVDPRSRRSDDSNPVISRAYIRV